MLSRSGARGARPDSASEIQHEHAVCETGRTDATDDVQLLSDNRDTTGGATFWKRWQSPPSAPVEHERGPERTMAGVVTADEIEPTVTDRGHRMID
jgi:hypothetical protein